MVVGKKHFSSVLKHAYEKAVTAANIKAGFRKAGIYPLSREPVDMTQIVKLMPTAAAVPTSFTAADAPTFFTAVPISSTAAAAPSSCCQGVSSSTTAMASSSSVVPTCSTSPTCSVCPTCNRSTKNDLVETGLIPQYLADILVTPTFGQRAEGIRCRVPLQARVITSEDYVAHLDNLEAKEKEKEEQKKKRKEEQQKNREAKRARQAKAARGPCNG
ncbi:hypothetical protein R3I93_006663 [Phoxinus phoxinus]|uniref:Uncharacterized protein n=1 Tax=Phoxinus phoxinus TaxID=58324 RepID=A0AAN9D6H9_9TELE